MRTITQPLDLTAYAGAAFEHVLSVVDSGGDAMPFPAGTTAALTVSRYGGGAAALSLTTAGGGLVVTANQITARVDATAWPTGAGTYVWSLTVTPGGVAADAYVLMGGAFYVLSEVTDGRQVSAASTITLSETTITAAASELLVPRHPDRLLLVDAGFAGLSSPYFADAAEAILQAQSLDRTAGKIVVVRGLFAADGQPENFDGFDAEALRADGIYLETVATLT